MGKSVRNAEVSVKTALFVSLCFLIHFVVTSSIIRYEGDKTAYFKIQDFHYYIVLIKSFWFHEILSIYDPTYRVAAIHLGVLRCLVLVPDGDGDFSWADELAGLRPAALPASRDGFGEKRGAVPSAVDHLFGHICPFDENPLSGSWNGDLVVRGIHI